MTDHGARATGPAVTNRNGQLEKALGLSYFTVGWNVVEAVVAIAAAVLAGSRAWLGFGLDSTVESMSAAVLIWRLVVERRNPHRAEAVEARAVRLIGVSFFVLAGFVGIESIRSLVGHHEPEASVVGIVLTSVSLVVMPVLAHRKRLLAAQMGSKAVEADSHQTQACTYFSAVVLGGLLLNAALVGGGLIPSLRSGSSCSWCSRAAKHSEPSTWTTAVDPGPMVTCLRGGGDQRAAAVRWIVAPTTAQMPRVESTDHLRAKIR